MSDIHTSSIPRSSSRKVKETPEQRKRKRIIQVSAGVILFILICLLASSSKATNPKAPFILLIGVIFGYILQRSRFCFTAALRDPSLTGGTDLTKAMIASLAVLSILFMAIDMSRFGMSLETFELPKAAGSVAAVGIHTAIGGFIFGIGAVLAGGCASGTLMRMGEGFMQQWLSFVFFVVGSILGMFLLPVVMKSKFLYPGKAVFLPQALGGWIPAIIVQFGLLLILYTIADIWGKKKVGAL